jgi:hypothetical protein
MHQGIKEHPGLNRLSKAAEKQGGRVRFCNMTFKTLKAVKNGL